MVVKGTQSIAFEPKYLRVRAENGGLVLDYRGEQHELAPPRRALPLSSPDEWIVLSSSEGDEIGTVRRLSELEPMSRDTLRAALEETYHITAILRILDVERDPLSGHIAWRVVLEASENEEDATEGFQSGKEATFHLAGAEDVQTARYPHIYFADIEGNRWEIANCEAMDLASRRASEKYF